MSFKCVPDNDICTLFEKVCLTILVVSGASTGCDAKFRWNSLSHSSVSYSRGTVLEILTSSISSHSMCKFHAIWPVLRGYAVSEMGPSSIFHRLPWPWLNQRALFKDTQSAFEQGHNQRPIDFYANAMWSPLALNELTLTHIESLYRSIICKRRFQLEAFRLLRVLVKLNLWFIALKSLVVKEDVLLRDCCHLFFSHLIDRQAVFFWFTNYFQQLARHRTHYFLLDNHLRFLIHIEINV